MSEKKEVTVSLEKPFAPTYAVNGAYGGVAPDGATLVVHLYVEGLALPNYLKYEAEDIDGGTRVDLQSEQKVSRGDVSRQIQATIVMTPETAKSLAAWLDGKADEGFSVRGRRQ